MSVPNNVATDAQISVQGSGTWEPVMRKPLNPAVYTKVTQAGCLYRSYAGGRYQTPTHVWDFPAFDLIVSTERKLAHVTTSGDWWEPLDYDVAFLKFIDDVMRGEGEEPLQL